jgi:hypothetical protein
VKTAAHLLVDDPAFRPREAAKYCGISLSSLLRYGVPRERTRRSADGKHDTYVYRRSTLNKFLAEQGSIAKGFR